MFLIFCNLQHNHSSLKKAHFTTLLLFLAGLSFSQESNSYQSLFILDDAVSKELRNDLADAKTNAERLKVLDTISKIYVQIDNADSLAHYGVEMRKLLSKDKPTEYDLWAFYYAGLGKQRQGLLDSSISQFLDGLSWSNQNQLARQYISTELANTYLLNSEAEKTQTILDTLVTQIVDPKLKVVATNYEGDYDYDNSEFNSAKQHYNDVIQQVKDKNWVKQELLANIGLGKVLLREDKVDDALALFQSIKDKALDSKFYDIYIKVIRYEGRIYSEKEDYQVAEIILGSAYMNTIQWNRKELQQKVIQDLYKLYNQKGDYENAYNLTTQYMALTNEISREQNAKLVRDLEVQYETLQKEKEISKLEASQLEKQNEIIKQRTIKNSFLIGFLVILIPVISFLIMYYQKLQAQSKLNAQQKKINAQEVKSLLQTQQLELTQATMKAQNNERSRIARELHDSIGGNLGAIKLQMSKDEANTDPVLLAQLDKTYEQVREISHSLIPKEFSEQTFTSLVKQYISTFSAGQSFEINCILMNEEELNAQSDALHVSLFNIIKELLNNAHKHADAKQIDIQINVDSEEDSTSLLYEDNGNGFDNQKINEGIGLKNLSDRVKEFNGSMNIDTAPGRGTVISLSLFNKIDNESN